MTPPDSHTAAVRRDLIFDLGLWEGQDSRFYLDKGFTVVAVEAHPHYAASARKAFARELAEGRFHLVESAIWSEGGISIPFHTRGMHSSVFKAAAERAGPSEQVTVQTTTLEELLAQYGVPYYLKCDVEGADEIVIAQIRRADALPDFVSVESSCVDTLALLATCGYDRFQLINQGYHCHTRIPVPPREGQYVKVRMSDAMTGLFGRELDRRAWMSQRDAEAAMRQREFIRSPQCSGLLRYLYRRIGKITGKRHLISRGWIDIHACRQATLDSAAAAF